jgi:ABC-2 type transport system permease protein
MSMHPAAIPEFSRETPVLETAQISAAWRFYWSVRRELWENRAIYLAPLAAAAVFLFAFLVGIARLPGKIRAAAALDPMQQREAIMQPYYFAAGLIMATVLILGVFYCLDALYGERRDRSSLFWKSLPVSDLTAVLAKASVPFVIVPLLGFAITAITHFIMLLASSAVLAGSGESVSLLWRQVSFTRMSLLLLYHLITVHSLWSAPLYGWLLLVSAWARRAPFVWAFLPPVAIGYLEKVTFNTSYFAHMVQSRIQGGMEAMPTTGSFVTDPMTHLTPLVFLSSAGLWIGFAITAAFLAGAVELRRRQGPI